MISGYANLESGWKSRPRKASMIGNVSENGSMSVNESCHWRGKCQLSSLVLLKQAEIERGT